MSQLSTDAKIPNVARVSKSQRKRDITKKPKQHPSADLRNFYPRAQEMPECLPSEMPELFPRNGARMTNRISNVVVANNPAYADIEAYEEHLTREEKDLFTCDSLLATRQRLNAYQTMLRERINNMEELRSAGFVEAANFSTDDAGWNSRDRKSTRLNSSHVSEYRLPSSALKKT